MRILAAVLSVAGGGCVLDATLSRAWDGGAVIAADVPVTSPDCAGLRPRFRWEVQAIVSQVDPCLTQEPLADDCSLRVRLPLGARRDVWCDAARGRFAVFGSANECRVRFVPTVAGQSPPAGEHGFYFARSPGAARCEWRVAFTPGDEWEAGAAALLECAVSAEVPAPMVAACGRRAVGEDCMVPMLGACPIGEAGRCFQYADAVFQTDAPACASRVCLTFRHVSPESPFTPRFDGSYCSCRCAVPVDLAATTDPRTLCACPRGYTCSSEIAGANYADSVRGSYCVRVPST